MSALAEVADLPTTATAPEKKPWYQSLANLDRSQKLKLGLGVVLMVGILVASMVMGRTPDYRVLFANLGDKDGGAIVAQLTQMNVPYKYSEGGGAILVPAEKVHDVRLRLASQGLPKGSVSGFEAMEVNRFGMTQFQERLSFQRGLEGELARSIQSLSAVQNARVHLALPQQNGFFRDQQKPSASVLVAFHGGRSLDKKQIAGIVHLVSSSVPELDPKMVSVVDDSGKLLSVADENKEGIDAQQLQYTMQLEQEMTRRIQDILEPVVGRGNVRAQVTADVDFSQIESTSETHRPNQGSEPAAVRSQQIIEASEGSTKNGQVPGIPGAVSNQPPSATSAPVQGNTPNLAVTENSGQSGQSSNNTKKESVTNYEVDKTVKTVKAATGNIRRMTAAVVINHRTSTDAQGKAVTKPLTEPELERMTQLVQGSIGFSKDRGDSVSLMNAAFAPEVVAVDNTPLWQQPVAQDLARTLAWPLGMVLLAAMVLFGMIKPVLKAANQPEPAPLEAGSLLAGDRLDAVVEEVPERAAITDETVNLAELSLLHTAPEHVKLEGARMLAKQNPIAVANILKHWVNGSEAAV